MTIYTDGACINNPGKGSWAYSITHNQQRIHACGYFDKTTNNRMELLAAIKSLELLSKIDEDFDIQIFSDSKYLVDGITSWIHGWVKKDYKGVKNPDLWKSLRSLTLHSRFQLKWSWVKGHNGNPGNEYVDKICSKRVFGEIKSSKDVEVLKSLSAILNVDCKDNSFRIVGNGVDGTAPIDSELKKDDGVVTISSLIKSNVFSRELNIFVSTILFGNYDPSKIKEIESMVKHIKNFLTHKARDYEDSEIDRFHRDIMSLLDSDVRMNKLIDFLLKIAVSESKNLVSDESVSRMKIAILCIMNILMNPNK